MQRNRNVGFPGGGKGKEEGEKERKKKKCYAPVNYLEVLHYYGSTAYYQKNAF